MVGFTPGSLGVLHCWAAGFHSVPGGHVAVAVGVTGVAVGASVCVGVAVGIRVEVGVTGVGWPISGVGFDGGRAASVLVGLGE